RAREAKEEEPCGFPIRVLGPYFSGSQASLALALQQARPNRPKGSCGILAAVNLLANPGLGPGILVAGGQLANPPVHVVCGSASSLDYNEFTKDWMCPGDACQATILPDFLVRRWVFKFLDNPAAPGKGDQPETV